MRECPAVASDEIERLQAKGIRLTLDQICWLASLGLKVEKPQGRLNPLLEAAPVVAGSEPFFPLTNQAGWWLELAAGWFDGLSVCHMLGYAHRFGRIAGAFDSLTTKAAAIVAVAEWRNKLPITDGEILAACERLNGSDAPHEDMDGERETPNYGEYIARAVLATGFPREKIATMTQAETLEVIRQAHIMAAQDLSLIHI